MLRGGQCPPAVRLRFGSGHPRGLQSRAGPPLARPAEGNPVGQPEMLPIKPALVGASTFIWRSPGELPAFGVGLVALGLTGKSDAVDCVARRRGIPRVRAVEERTGDIAH